MMSMSIRKGSDLIDYITTNRLEDVPVVVGAEGYTNAIDIDNETFAEIHRLENGTDILLIADSCVYDITEVQ